MSLIYAVPADAYVDGPGIVMELIQNADDAGATEVSLMLDMHSYPTESLIGIPPLASFLSSAVLLASISASDWSPSS